MKSGYLIRHILILLMASTALSAGPKVLGPPRLLIGMEGEYFMHPIWSPDGAHIAFTNSNYQGLWVIQADGQKL
ncbi:hypothetical protein L0128_18085, partial [candidate division KSB1 bacterium]|nr:hypothetical protein [candidate division KSB1 bacterium]